MPYLILAIPFLIGIAALRGLTVALPMFHGSDELNYHLPTILRFAGQLPFPDIGAYNAAQTPLFHLVMAYAGKLVGYELWRLRLLEVAISYLLSLSVFALLHRRLGIARGQALALALLFSLSPYVLAASFRLMTDNLALLFCVLCVERLEAFRQSGRLAPFTIAAACAGAALLTRQSTAFLFGVAGLYALAGGDVRSPRLRLAALASLGVAVIPAGLLFLTWHGLTPPGGDTSSCGLCAGSHGGTGGTGLRVTSLELTLAVIGAYGFFLFAPAFAWRDRAAWRRLAGGALAAAVAGGLLLLLFPMRPDLRPAGTPTTAGLLWNLAGRLPSVAGSSLLFWALVPLSGAVLRWRYAVAPRRFVAIVVLGCFLIGSLVVRLAWQKYVDPYALLVLLLTAAPAELAGPRRLAGAGVLAAGFVAYALSFVI